MSEGDTFLHGTKWSSILKDRIKDEVNQKIYIGLTAFWFPFECRRKHLKVLKRLFQIAPIGRSWILYPNLNNKKWRSSHLQHWQHIVIWFSLDKNMNEVYVDGKHKKFVYDL